MIEDIFVNQDRIIEAVKLICHTLEDNGFSQIEGAIAMNACLNTLKEQGIDVRSEYKQ